MSEKKTIIVWFRQDLRIEDNPALYYALQEKNVTILPIYILDETNSNEHIIGAAQKVWLHHALVQLNDRFDGQLYLFKGSANTILQRLSENGDIHGIYWNRCYEPWRIKRDQDIKQFLLQSNIDAQSFNGSLLWEPWEVSKKDGTPYRVFTPFYRRGCLQKPAPRKPLPKPQTLQFPNKNLLKQIATLSCNITELSLLPNLPWHTELEQHWDLTKNGATRTLNAFFQSKLQNYKKGRDFPELNSVSRVAPYLHFGQLSIHQIWEQSLKYESNDIASNNNLDHFQSELGWREFSHSLLFHFPQLPEKNLQTKFDDFPWTENPTYLKAWQQGKTGYPIVDAGMRELYQTGYMHNRVRMITGSFLVKNLLLHWHHGRDWFWDCLFDADLANNSAGWQWIAGCGADAAPYFRIFNPITQGEKFDAQGQYTRRFVPELKELPDKYLFKPWEAPAEVLKKANITLGKDYPKPIVDLKASRERALAALATLKK